jgi:GT2 family glycosyltransferase
MNSNNNPLVYIIVLTFNGEIWVEKCLNSLSRTSYPYIKILVIDNASQDDTIDIIKKNFPMVELHINDYNTGFAAGMNQGIDYALQGGADYVFLVNQDTIMDSFCIQRLVDVALTDVNIGIIAPVQFEYGIDQLQKTFARWLVLNIGVSDLKSLWYLKKSYFVVPEVLGPAMMISRKAIELAGSFDPYFFAYFEETDLCRRLRLHAMFSVLCPWAFFWHADDLPEKSKELIMLRSHLIYTLKDPFSKVFTRWSKYFLIILNNLIRYTLTGRFDMLLNSIKISFSLFLDVGRINKRRKSEITGCTLFYN